MVYAGLLGSVITADGGYFEFSAAAAGQVNGVMAKAQRSGWRFDPAEFPVESIHDGVVVSVGQPIPFAGKNCQPLELAASKRVIDQLAREVLQFALLGVDELRFQAASIGAGRRSTAFGILADRLQGGAESSFAAAMSVSMTVPEVALRCPTDANCGSMRMRALQAGYRTQFQRLNRSIDTAVLALRGLRLRPEAKRLAGQAARSYRRGVQLIGKLPASTNVCG